MKPRPKAKPKDASHEELSMTINGHELKGTKSRGKWAWKCPSYPEWAVVWKDSESATGIIGDFVRMVMQDAVYISKLASGQREAP